MRAFFTGILAGPIHALKSMKNCLLYTRGAICLLVATTGHFGRSRVIILGILIIRFKFKYTCAALLFCVDIRFSIQSIVTYGRPFMPRDRME